MGYTEIQNILQIRKYLIHADLKTSTVNFLTLIYHLVQVQETVLVTIRSLIHNYFDLPRLVYFRSKIRNVENETCDI
jgi:hypothetical protein